MIKARQVNPNEWLRRRYEVALSFRTGIPVLAPSGPFEWEEFFDEGLGPARAVGLETPSGEQFLLEDHKDMPEPFGVSAYFVEPLEDAVEILNDVLGALELTSASLAWLSPRISLPPFDLWRQDDNGNRFYIDQFPCRADAEHARDGYERRGHKQAYFVERAESPRKVLRREEDGVLIAD
jgi:hypothetical protein